MPALVLYIHKVFFADRKLHADPGPVLIYPASGAGGFPDKHRAPEYELATSSALQTFALPQFELFSHSSAEQVDENMPFHFSLRNSYYRFNIHGSAEKYPSLRLATVITIADCRGSGGRSRRCREQAEMA